MSIKVSEYQPDHLFTFILNFDLNIYLFDESASDFGSDSALHFLGKCR